MSSTDLDHSPANTKHQHTPARVWIGLAIAVALDAPVQLMWKALMMKYHAHPQFIDLLHQARWFSREARSWGLLVLFACQFFDWIWVLGNADLSFAQPFTALSYVVVSTGAVISLHEHLGPLRIVGILCILIGVILVGSSDHRTTPKELA